MERIDTSPAQDHGQAAIRAADGSGPQWSTPKGFTPLIPEPVWATVVDLVDPVTGSDIGWTAYARRCWDAAGAAFRRAPDGGEVRSGR